jgi:hypothetical protein
VIGTGGGRKSGIPEEVVVSMGKEKWRKKTRRLQDRRKMEVEVGRFANSWGGTSRRRPTAAPKGPYSCPGLAE